MKKPKIRFKGYTADWEQRKVSEEVTSIDTGKSKYEISVDGNYEILGSTGVIGYDNSYDYEGDFLLTARVGANAGTLYRHSGKVKITDNTVFLQGNHIDFIFYLLDKFDLKKLSFGSGQPLIKASEIKELELLMPTSVEEKQRISSYFTSLDHLITLHQRKCEETKKLKKYMLQKMFPKDGADVPEIRFAGFTDAWEQRKLGEITGNVIGGGTPKTSVDEYWGGDIPWIQSSNVQEDQLFDVDIQKGITEVGLEKSAAKLVPANSIAVVTHVGVGKLVYMPFSYTTSQDFTSLADLKTDAIFTSYSIYKRLKNDLHVVQGSAIKGITKDDLLAKEIMIPCMEEQKKIGKYFTSLDHLITLHQRKCDELKKIKKFMLQNMFV